jgi:hypothetical protein
MNENNRITSGSTIIDAGKTENISNNGRYSFHISFSTNSGDECDFCPPNVIYNNSGKYSGQLTYSDNNIIQYVNSLKCCSKYNQLFYPNLEEDGGICYWCPPLDYFVAVPIYSALTADNQLTPAGEISGPVTPVGPIKPVIPQIKGDKFNISKYPIGPTTPSNEGSTKLIRIPNQYYYETPDGTLVKPSKDCCKLRGFKWDEVNKRCVNNTTTTPGGNTTGFVSISA